MRKLISSMHGGQKGFTLIELLVVIAILGVIAAIVALNVAGFFGRGTLQAAKTELHQAQTAIISAMADAENNKVYTGESAAPVLEGSPVTWAGEENIVLIQTTGGNYTDAAAYVYGPFRAVYRVDYTGAITFGWSDTTHAGAPLNLPDNPWGPNIVWSEAFQNWEMG